MTNETAKRLAEKDKAFQDFVNTLRPGEKESLGAAVGGLEGIKTFLTGLLGMSDESKTALANFLSLKTPEVHMGEMVEVYAPQVPTRPGPSKDR